MDRTWETGFESVSFLRYESQILDLLIDFLGLEFKVNWTPCQGHSKFFRSIG